jgi:hypothetical protein
MEQHINSSRETHPLFSSDRSYGNIVLNFQHAANSEFGIYARAFHRAGQALFEQMFAKPSYNSLEGCPIIFLYRHALELYLKAVVLHGDVIMRLNGETLLTNRRLLQRHTLLPFLPLLKRTFDAVDWTWELDIEGLQTFEEVEELLRDFDAVDVGSYTFRYPVDTQGNPSVPHHFSVHMPTFCKRMDALLESLEAAVMGLEVTEDNMLEAAYHAQNGVGESGGAPAEQP